MGSVYRFYAAATLLVVAVPAFSACWKPVPTPSALAFQVKQPGNESITGEFTRYDGVVCLDPDNPGSARINLDVETASVDTRLPELDRALKGPTFFDSSRWPQATFRSESVHRLKSSDRYEVRGKFTLHGVARNITVPFTFIAAPNGKSASLQGMTTIRRLDYGIGQGQFADVQWAANDVKLEFTVKLAPQQADD